MLAYPSNNEQGFTLRTAGSQRRSPIDFDGLTLIGYNQSKETAKPI